MAGFSWSGAVGRLGSALLCGALVLGACGGDDTSGGDAAVADTKDVSGATGDVGMDADVALDTMIDASPDADADTTEDTAADAPLDGDATPPQDTDLPPPTTTTVSGPTSGGATLSSDNYKLRAFVGGPSPAASRSSSSYRLRVGVGSPVSTP